MDAFIIAFSCICIFFSGLTLGVTLHRLQTRKAINRYKNEVIDYKRKLNEALTEHEAFLGSVWPEKNPQITMTYNIADYLRDKHLNSETDNALDDTYI